MSSKTKKAQVVLAALDQPSHKFQFLLMRTNERRGGFWQNVTGKLEDNETYEEGGLREAIEETGLNIETIMDMLNLGLKYEFTDQRERKCHEECFLIILDQKWEVKIDSHEHQDFKWVGIDEIHRDIVKHESNFETLVKSQHLLKHWGG
ncbi:NUDIX domain-containing protein [Peredibacter starrii]|uniref:NUDIX domain-containing protein n=1 Tax=Peredibacter starrii TaxID=28202 RepID=A0AAX4HS13_9BACT|nr:NUDIX domain-containing protein [Peredibacter starrii]WPU65883.1 NUDIX domain-containing protein [Peredibacter starrii]